MNIIGIDPGPTTCGVVYYSLTERRLMWSEAAMSVEDTLLWLDQHADAVIIERVESYGIAGNSLLRTAEVVGRLQQRCIDALGLDPVLLPRREVCRALSVVGGAKDAQVRHAMIARHGGTKAEAVGTKKAPGPLYGIAGHAWQALGLVVGWDVLQQAEVTR